VEWFSDDIESCGVRTFGRERRLSQQYTVVNEAAVHATDN